MLLSLMMDKYKDSNNNMIPMVEHFNSVLQACNSMPRSGRNYSALKVAISLFQELQDFPFAKPNEQTFHKMFQVCSDHTEEEEKRDILAGKVFRSVCRQGLLMETLLDDFRDLASPGLREKLLGEYWPLLSLPSEWRCKIIGRDETKKNLEK